VLHVSLGILRKHVSVLQKLAQARTDLGIAPSGIDVADGHHRCCRVSDEDQGPPQPWAFDLIARSRDIAGSRR
jgi:hypothetical protein